MLRKLMRALVVLAFAAGLSSSFVQAAHADFSFRAVAEPDCKTVSASIADRVDSAVGGYNWALDTFTRKATVCAVDKHEVLEKSKSVVPVQSWTYQIKGSDEGTFVTTGIKSPQSAGVPMKADVKGAFSGAWSMYFEAPANWLGFTNPNNTNAYSTSQWIAKLWADGYQPAEKKFVWGWKYETCNEVWINSVAGNHGNITGLSKSIGKCWQVSFVDKCDGTLVTLGNQAPSDSTVITYYVNGTKYEVKGGADATVITVVAADVVVKSRGHLDWRHHYTRPTCATPTSSPVPPVDNGQPQPPLPVTGPNTGLYVGGGVIFVAAGVVLYLATRRRRTRFTA